jgi:hypothetical protein
MIVTSFLTPPAPVTTESNWDKLGATGDAERTNDRQTCIKLGPGVLGTRVETHNSFIAFLLLFALLLFSIFSLRPYSFTIL